MPVVIPLVVGGYVLQAELALTREQRAQGLMGRTHMPENSGLLMCYPYPQLPMVWMKGTLLPLTVAFLDEEKKIIEMMDLEPLDATIRQCTVDWACYSLEVRLGWLASRGVGKGAVCSFELPEGVVPS